VGLKPALGSGDNLEELFRLGRALQLGLALALGDPEDGVVGVAVDGLIVQALLPTEGEGVDDGKELSDVVGAVDGAEVEHLVARLEVDGLILHRAGIARAGGIHRPGICPYFHRKRKYGVVAVIRRI